MKNKIFSLLAAGTLLFSSVSCSNFLDQVPDNVLTVDDIFKSKLLVDNYLAQIYSDVPDEFRQRFVTNGMAGPWTAASDEAKYTWDFNYAGNMNLSSWSVVDGAVNSFWIDYYKSIRNATDFIDKIDGANPQEVTNSMKSRYKAEARALRAMYYFWLVRMYGPVPIIDKVIAPDAPLSDVLKSRNTMDECISFITSELDIAAIDLAVKHIDEENGRITKGVAKAYKQQALMLAASPLFNGNSYLSRLVDKDGKALVNQTYDEKKWETAAKAAKDFIDEFVPTTYDLYVVADADPFKQAYLSTRNVVINQWNKEWIFGRAKAASDITRYDRTPKHVGYTSATQGAGALGATQTMVDAYFMKNGLPIDNTNSGYIQAAGFTNFQAPFDVKSRSTFNQWVNREPRFYVGITYNNSYWLNQGGNDREVITNMEFSGNSGRSQSTSDVSPTGYIVRKNVGVSGNDRAILHLRLANIYLDYVEALNEYAPNNPDILKYLNLIRIRAGIPAYGTGADMIAAPSGKAAMRDAIRRERRVELAFENVRYFDCRRWLIAEQTNNGPVFGMNMFVNGNAFYEKTQIENRVFRQRDYLWPIPNGEIIRNNLLVQNPGW